MECGHDGAGDLHGRGLHSGAYHHHCPPGSSEIESDILSSTEWIDPGCRGKMFLIMAHFHLMSTFSGNSFVHAWMIYA
jgi:hypothetical protein